MLGDFNEIKYKFKINGQKSTQTLPVVFAMFPNVVQIFTYEIKPFHRISIKSVVRKLY